MLKHPVSMDAYMYIPLNFGGRPVQEVPLHPVGSDVMKHRQVLNALGLLPGVETKLPFPEYCWGFLKSHGGWMEGRMEGWATRHETGNRACYGARVNADEGNVRVPKAELEER
jgi:hypothetical protein